MPFASLICSIFKAPESGVNLPALTASFTLSIFFCTLPAFVSIPAPLEPNASNAITPKNSTAVSGFVNPSFNISIASFESTFDAKLLILFANSEPTPS